MLPLCLRLFPFALALSVTAADRTVPNRTTPASGISIPDTDRQRLERGAAQLATQMEALRSRAVSNAIVRELLPDVEIFHKAVDWALRYDEFFRTNEIAQADNLLRLGSARAQQLAAGQPAWLTSTGLVVRGYRSKIDGSVQPYGLVVPATFASNTNQERRLDVWLHGRDDKLTELKFISDRLRSHGEFTPPDTLVLHPYGRFCNAFKFAGETDVFEAIAHAQRAYPVDTNRLAIRGFSMGGAGTWHLAAHHPETWAAAAPGAGFAETAEYTGALLKSPKPPWYEQRLWHFYDATDYALNLFTVPTIAYSGEIDKQKQAADIMARAMKREGLELQHVIGPGVAHKYEPSAKREVAQRVDQLMQHGRDPLPARIHFTTSTLRYSQSPGLNVSGLFQHWMPARVDAEFAGSGSLKIKTANVSSFSITCPPASFQPSQSFNVEIDQDSLRVAFETPRTLYFSREQNKWKTLATPATSALPRKSPKLQGPIDDAFMEQFVIVRPSSPPQNAKVGEWIDTELARFTNEWRAQFRGDVPIATSVEAVARAATSGAHLVLWGDPASNPLIAKLLPRLATLPPRLPLDWDAKQLRLGTNSFDAATHVPVLIFPNPLNPSCYIVLNSGPTFFDFGAASNAQQTPKLPDYAVLDITVPHSEKFIRGVALAGFFDEAWKLPDASTPVTR